MHSISLWGNGENRSKGTETYFGRMTYFGRTGELEWYALQPCNIQISSGIQQLRFFPRCGYAQKPLSKRQGLVKTTTTRTRTRPCPYSHTYQDIGVSISGYLGPYLVLCESCTCTAAQGTRRHLQRTSRQSIVKLPTSMAGLNQQRAESANDLQAHELEYWMQREKQ